MVLFGGKKSIGMTTLSPMNSGVSNPEGHVNSFPDLPPDVESAMMHVLYKRYVMWEKLFEAQDLDSYQNTGLT